MKLFREILNHLDDCISMQNHEITETQMNRMIANLTLDSRLVNTSDIFCALPGKLQHGMEYAEEAITRNASAILTTEDAIAARLVKKFAAEETPIIGVKNFQETINNFAAWFYDYPAENLTMIGVTGTNGKTSVTQFIAKAYKILGKTCGVIGTLGYGFPNDLTSFAQSQAPTTPDPIALQRIIADLRCNAAKQSNIEAIAMEVTSHALDQNRVSALQFKIAIMTNITRDHLDYHGSFAGYTHAKAKILQQSGLEFAIVNDDDAVVRSLYKNLDASIQLLRYSIASTETEIHAKNIVYADTGISALIITPWGNFFLRTSLLGEFNLSNLLAVTAVLGLQGFALDKIADALQAITTLPGRMQAMQLSQGPLVIIDYAHTPHALELLLQAARKHCVRKLWCVFGCGGNRDAGKRPLMGAIAERLADSVVITSDNPRNENSIDIIKAILDGMQHPLIAHVEEDRAAAIKYAISQAHSGDVVVVAGKGHENYQEINGVRLPFSDQVVIESLVNSERLSS